MKNEVKQFSFIWAQDYEGDKNMKYFNIKCEL